MISRNNTGVGSASPRFDADSNIMNMINGNMNANAIGGIGSGLARLLFSGNSPSGAANKYLDKIPGQISPYLDPYMNAGKNSLNILQGEYGNLLKDPGSLLARLGKGYTASPGYNFERDQGLQSIENAAAAGGMLGTGQHQQQAGDLATNLAGKDFETYLSHALGLYGTGLQGEEGINQMGYNASNSFADVLAKILGSKASGAYEEEAANNAGFGNAVGDIFGGLSHFLF